MWRAVSLRTTNPFVRLLLITAYPTKPSGVFFVLPARRKQDRRLLIALDCLWERLSEMDDVAV